MDTGFWMWSFQGKVLKRNNSNTFCEFKWRPRPLTLLSESKLKDIKKSLKKKYTVQFEQKDRIRLTKASKVGFCFQRNSYYRILSITIIEIIIIFKCRT